MNHGESAVVSNALTGDVAAEKVAAEAYARVAADIAALTPEQLLQVNLDVQTATSTVLGVLPEVKAVRDRIAKELPAFDLTLFDKLEDYALALRFTQGAYQTATLPPDDLQALAEQASSLRERLVTDAKALALHGLFDPRKLEQLKGANGYKNVAQDLEALSQALQESWSTIQGKSPLAAEDLQTASRVGTRLTRVIGQREQGPALLAKATDERLRAFTLMLGTYEEVRHAVRYLRRHEDDADSITPSLYPGKGKRRSSDPVPTPVIGPAPVIPTVPPPSAAPVHDAAAQPQKGPATSGPFMS